jgi:hypothetical protein
MPDTRVLEMSGKTLKVIDVNTYQTRIIESLDTLVYCTYNQTHDELYKAIKRKVKKLEPIGDAWGPRSSMHAIHNAFYLAREV